MSKNIFHILIVDDDDRIRELVKEYLEENKFIVSTAINASDAKKKIEMITLRNQTAIGLILLVILGLLVF